MKNILCVVETAYRGTQEEQDDAVLWFTHALKNGGGDVGILLRGNAVNYAVAAQDPAGLVIGRFSIEHPANPNKDLLKMKQAGILVHVVREHTEERGIALNCLSQEFQLISRREMPELFSRYAQVWHW